MRVEEGALQHNRVRHDPHVQARGTGPEARGDQKEWFPLASYPSPLAWPLCDFATNRNA